MTVFCGYAPATPGFVSKSDRRRQTHRSRTTVGRSSSPAPHPGEGRVSARLGLDVRFHDLRHICVTLPLGLGAPSHLVRDIVEHSALEVTRNIYAHVDLTEKRAALDRPGTLLSGE